MYEKMAGPRGASESLRRCFFGSGATGNFAHIPTAFLAYLDVLLEARINGPMVSKWLISFL